MFSMDDDNVPFFHGNLDFLEGGEIVFSGLVFTNLSFLRLFPYHSKSKILAVDGTFGVVPWVPANIDQLVTIYVILDNIVSDLIYVEH